MFTMQGGAMDVDMEGDAQLLGISKFVGDIREVLCEMCC